MTVEEVARSVLGAISTSANLLLAARWVSERYQKLCSRTRFRHLRTVKELLIPADIADGTATFVRGSRVITGDATARSVWDARVVGRHIRAATTWYLVEDATAGELRLTEGFGEADTASAYRVVPRHVTLAPTAKWLGDFVLMRRRRPLRNLTLAELDAVAPERQRITTPDVWAEIGYGLTPDGERARTVELYPYADDTELVHYVCWEMPEDLSYASAIPAVIDPYVLKEGALIDAMRFEAAVAARAGQIEVAAYWRNEYRAQATSWERDILEAIRGDKGVDDVTFIMQRAGVPASEIDIVTARDEVFVRGARP